MRCLYCNKKLSLLKLAKGDSFCSPEHFDAHQLQLSKDAIQRLMSVPEEEAPKTPLVVKQPEEQPDENAALARLTAFAPPPPPPLPELAALKSPPYAPFAISTLAACSPDALSAIVNGPDAGEAVESARELAFPVHGVEGTVCILNLYLRLSLAGTEPMDWTSERHLIVTPEDFQLEIKQPPIGFMPEFQQAENLVPVELAEPVELAPPVALTQSVEAVPPVETAHLIEEELTAPSVKPLMPAEPASVTPIEIPEPRVPFLVAPSFQARAGAPILLHDAASAVPNGSMLAPILDKDNLPRLDSCDAFPKSTRVAGNTAFHRLNSTAHWIKGADELPIAPAFVLPAGKEQICAEAWRPSDRRIMIVRPALDASREAMRSLDFDLPAPASLLERPDPRLLGEVDPQQLLAGVSPLDTVSLFLGALETRPPGHEPLFVDPPAFAVEYGWRAILAPFPGREHLPTAWRDRTSYFSLPDPIAAGPPSPMLPLEALPYAPSCTKIDGIKKAELPAPFVAKDFYRPTEWAGTDSASALFQAEPGLVFKGSTMLPRVAAVPPGSLKKGSGDPALPWEPRVPADQAPPAVRFLPVRDGAVLPGAKSWPRLESVPR